MNASMDTQVYVSPTFTLGEEEALFDARSHKGKSVIVAIKLENLHQFISVFVALAEDKIDDIFLTITGTPEKRATGWVMNCQSWENPASMPRNEAETEEMDKEEEHALS